MNQTGVRSTGSRRHARRNVEVVGAATAPTLPGLKSATLRGDTAGMTNTVEDAAAAPRVLVADDDPDVRMLLVTNLLAEGFRVEEADNGDDARDLARQVAPDVIVLDVMMPGRDGFDVLTALKGNPATRDIPVVLLTARASDQDVWQGWRAGADYYLTKPFDLDELLRYIDVAVARRRG
jgi:CheY-like chemotaxis protein